ncbi:MAG: guanylate kinase [Calditrichaeota bacterium]|nr:MAG: guanylate kinase [Calditrichota bacterium]
MKREKYLKPILIVISAPSGTGKTTVCRELLKRNPDFRLSISATTRPPRITEANGVDYFFLSNEEFMDKVRKGEFLEYEKVFGHYYGTLKSTVENYLKEGYSVLFDIDVNGALKIKEHYPDALLIFIKPPSLEELKERLKNRKTDTPEQIQERLSRLPIEYEKSKLFNVQVVNKELQETVLNLEKIIREYQRKLDYVSQ